MKYSRKAVLHVVGSLKVATTYHVVLFLYLLSKLIHHGHIVSLFLRTRRCFYVIYMCHILRHENTRSQNVLHVQMQHVFYYKCRHHSNLNLRHSQHFAPESTQRYLNLCDHTSVYLAMPTLAYSLHF